MYASLVSLQRHDHISFMLSCHCLPREPVVTVKEEGGAASRTEDGRQDGPTLKWLALEKCASLCFAPSPPPSPLLFDSLAAMAGQQPVFVMNSAPERQSGRKAQLSNISAAKVRLRSRWTSSRPASSLYADILVLGDQPRRPSRTLFERVLVPRQCSR